MLIIHVGERKFCKSVARLSELDDIHPKHFKDALQEVSGERWTNNPYVLDHVSAAHIIVHDAYGSRQLSSIDDWEKTCNILTPGEFWSSGVAERNDR